MIQALKSMVVVLVLTGLTIAGVKQLLNEHGKALLARHLMAFVIAGQLAFFLAPNGWTCILLSGFLMFFARTRLEVGCLYVVAMIALPNPSLTLAPGGMLIASLNPRIAMAIVATALMLAKPREGGGFSRFDLPALALFLLAVFWSGRAGDVNSIIRAVIAQLLTIGLPYYIFSRALSVREDLRAFLLHVSIAGLMLSAYLVFESVRFWPLYPDTFVRVSEDMPGTIVKMRGGLLRASGPVMEPTQAALMALTAAVATFGIGKLFKANALHLLCIAALCIGILMPQSRNALIGFGIATLAFAFYRNVFLKTVLPLAAAGCVAVMLSLASGEGIPIFSASEVTQGPDYREILLVRGIEEFWKNPVFGLPYHALLVSMRDLVQGEQIVDFVNTYLYVGLQTGSVGLVLLAVALLAPPLRLLGLRSPNDPDDSAQPALAAAFGGMLSFAIMITFTSPMPLVLGVFLVWAAVTSAAGAVIRAPTETVEPPEMVAAQPEVPDIGATRTPEHRVDGWQRLPGFGQ